ncbi:MAG: PEGA domain-containing protein, partial [Brevinematales bacterium]
MFRLLVLGLCLVGLESAWCIPFVVETVPTGVEVYLRGTKVGITPFRTNLLPGIYTLELQKQGYKSWMADIRVPSNVWVRLLPTNSHFRFVKAFRTGHQPKDIIFSPDERYLYISLLDAPKIQIYDRYTGEIKDIFIPEERRIYKGIVEGVFTPDGREY